MRPPDAPDRRHRVGPAIRGNIRGLGEVTLLGALETLMPAGTTWTRPTGGLFVWLTLPEGLDSKAMMPRAIAARQAGMFSMREDGERWVRSGATAPEEILRVTRDA